VSPGGEARNWQGESRRSGEPRHSTRKVYENPAVFEFASPIAGTYPPTFDPVYWSAGRVWTFDLRKQMAVISRYLMMYFELFLHSQAGLLVMVAALIVRGGRSSLRGILIYWPLLALAGCAFGLYMLVHAETRFLGAQVVVAWIALLAGIRVPKQIGDDKLIAIGTIAAAATILISVMSFSAHAWRGDFPDCTEHVRAAEELDRLGIHPGSQVAVIGDGDWAYWAHLDRARIVAELMESDAPKFWALSPEQRSPIYDAMQRAGAAAVVAQPALPLVMLDNGWARIGSTSYYMHWFPHQDGVLAESRP
jgi:hypothetical protein